MNGWSIIQTFLNPQDAYMARSLLESEGIETLLQDELTIQANWAASALGGVKLLVRNDDLQKGRTILEKTGYIVNPENEQVSDWVWVVKKEDRKECPFCHSVHIGKCKDASVASKVLFFLLGAFWPLFKSTWKCDDCRKAWKYKC